MSYSQPKIKNPASKFIQFKGETGKFQYYDKENEQNVEILLPIYFVVLDELHTVRGYNKHHKSGVFANEIKNIKKDLLNVRVFKTDIHIVGLWEKIKGEVERIQGSYSKSVYGMMFTKDTFEMVNFQMTGAMRKPWFDFKIDKEKYAVGIVDIIEDSNGSVIFKRPVFKIFNLRPIDHKKAIEFDKELQNYFKTYFVRSEDEAINDSISNELENLKEPPESETLPDPGFIENHRKEMEDKWNNDLPF